MALLVQLLLHFSELLHVLQLLIFQFFPLKHLFSLLQNVFSHFHGLFKVLIPVFHDLLQRLLVQHNHFLLIFEKLSRVVLLILVHWLGCWRLVAYLLHWRIWLSCVRSWEIQKWLLLLVDLRMRLHLEWLKLRSRVDNLLSELPLLLSLLSINIRLIHYSMCLILCFGFCTFDPVDWWSPLFITAFKLTSINNPLRFLFFNCPAFSAEVSPFTPSEDLSFFL